MPLRPFTVLTALKKKRKRRTAEAGVNVPAKRLCSILLNMNLKKIPNKRTSKKYVLPPIFPRAKSCTAYIYKYHIGTNYNLMLFYASFVF